MLKKSAPTILAAIALSFGASHAGAAEMKVLASGAMSHALQEISEDFVRKNGHTLSFTAGTTGVLQDKVRAGEKADLIEVTSAGMDALEKEKLVVPGSAEGHRVMVQAGLEPITAH
jgi:ABC-type molybdate transport system substrate-binding protein